MPGSGRPNLAQSVMLQPYTCTKEVKDNANTIYTPTHSPIVIFGVICFYGTGYVCRVKGVKI